MLSSTFRRVIILASLAVLTVASTKSEATDYYARPYPGSYFRNFSTRPASPYAPYYYSNLKIVNLRSAYGPNNTTPNGDYPTLALRRNAFGIQAGVSYGLMQPSAPINTNAYYYSTSPIYGYPSQNSYYAPPASYYTPRATNSSGTTGGSAYFSAVSE